MQPHQMDRKAELGKCSSKYEPKSQVPEEHSWSRVVQNVTHNMWWTIFTARKALALLQRSPDEYSWAFTLYEHNLAVSGLWLARPAVMIEWVAGLLWLTGRPAVMIGWLVGCYDGLRSLLLWLVEWLAVMIDGMACCYDWLKSCYDCLGIHCSVIRVTISLYFVYLSSWIIVHYEQRLPCAKSYH